MADDQLAGLLPSIEQRIIDFVNRDHDVCKLFLVMDDRSLVNSGGHYLLYGSEWILGVLGLQAHEALRRRGIPTVLRVNLPLHTVTSYEREHLARTMLQEWTRIKVNRPNWTPELDFTFCLREDVPGENIVDHFHPELIPDPLHCDVVRRTSRLTCVACERPNLEV